MTFSEIQKSLYDISLINATGSLLSWDMSVMMPQGSDRSFRADQTALLNGIVHEKITDKQLKANIDHLISKGGLSDSELIELQIIQKDIIKFSKLSKTFVEKESKLTGEAYTIWEKAKKESDFKLFEPSLNKIVEILIEKCDMLGYEDHPYNALIDNYEEGMTITTLDALFGDVKQRLGVLIEKVINKQKKKTNILAQQFDISIQNTLVHELLDVLKMDKEQMRIDISSHPFCSGFHPTDLRITTRYIENDLMSSIWSAIHECGHAKYEMGLNKDKMGLPSSSSVSLGIHESQSRFWENNIGRSKEFIALLLPVMTQYFPKQMENVTVQDLFDEINYVEPTLIRTESDELTYHYHIMIRYEIEKKLLTKELKVSDVNAYWNEAYSKYLNVTVPNDSQGALQDVHWSFAGIGYFPTYSLGSFYAAQWHDKIETEMNLSQLVSTGQMNTINDWHSKHIHQYGSLYSSETLCQKATGLPLTFDKFEKYISKKFEL